MGGNMGEIKRYTLAHGGHIYEYQLAAYRQQSDLNGVFSSVGGRQVAAARHKDVWNPGFAEHGFDKTAAATIASKCVSRPSSVPT